MRWPERLLLLAVAALLLAGCRQGRDTKAGKIRRIEQVAPNYNLRDDRHARTRMQYLELLRLSGDRLGRQAFDEAVKYARSAQKLAPRVADAYTVEAVIEGQRGNAAAAGALYRKAVGLAPKQGDVLNNYGAWLCGNGFPAEALVWFDRALADPDYGLRADALANAGGCALEAGQRERAGQDLRQALALSPQNAYALESMARHEYALGHYFEARAFYQRRLAAAPATASVLQLAIQIEERLGDGSAASRYQQRLRREFPPAAAPNPKADAL